MTASDRLVRILDRVAVRRSEHERLGTALCAAGVDVIGLPGAGILLLDADEHRGAVGVSDPVMATLEELEFTLGEGPCIDAYTSGVPVAEPDLVDPVVARWPGFRGPAIDAGASAVFGFPLQIGAVRFGSLNLYHDRVGPLDADQFENAVVFAHVAGHAVLAEQSESRMETLADELADVGANLARVHQAAGMISVQLDVDVKTALLRLRARAFAAGMPVSVIADDVVARRLRFEP